MYIILALQLTEQGSLTMPITLQRTLPRTYSTGTKRQKKVASGLEWTAILKPANVTCIHGYIESHQNTSQRLPTLLTLVLGRYLITPKFRNGASKTSAESRKGFDMPATAERKRHDTSPKN